MYTPEKNQEKIIETKTLFRDIIKEPGAFKNDETLRKALKSQSGIAKYENEQRNIVTCSLNTVKTTSEALLERGFVGFDELRNNAKNALEDAILGNNLESNKTTQVSLKNDIAKLKQDLDVARRSNYLLTTIIEEMRAKLKQLSESNAPIEYRQELYRTFNKEIEAQLSYTLHGEI